MDALDLYIKERLQVKVYATVGLYHLCQSLFVPQLNLLPAIAKVWIVGMLGQVVKP